jgi:hypothetical protein
MFINVHKSTDFQVIPNKYNFELVGIYTAESHREKHTTQF